MHLTTYLNDENKIENKVLRKKEKSLGVQREKRTGQCRQRRRRRWRGLNLWDRSHQDSSAVIGQLYGVGHLSALLLCGVGRASTWGLVTSSGSRPPNENLHCNEPPDRPQAQWGLRSLT